MTDCSRLFALVLAGWLAACGGDLGDLTPGGGGTAASGGSARTQSITDAATGGADARVDANGDARTDGAPDVSADGVADARSDNRADAIADVAFDSAADATRDGSPDAVVNADAVVAGDAMSDASGGTTTNAILSTKAADCLACAQGIAAGTGCELSVLNCETFLPANPTQARSCIATLQCVVPSSCVAEAFKDVSPCYCGTAIGAACLTAGAANGVCQAVIETGVGSTNPAIISGSLTSTTLGTGVAMQLMQCLADFDCQSCF
jgi:hypothetical protein